MSLNLNNGMGTPTWKDQIKDKLRQSGVENAAGVLVIAENGDSVLIVSDSNPNLSRTDAISSIEVKQSARAGNEGNFSYFA